MEPVCFVTVSVDVTVCDGSKCPVRAIQFIQAVAHGGITDAIRNVVMKAVDAGTLNKHGAKVPLSLSGKGERAAIPAIAGALRRANSGLTDGQAKYLVLKDLIDDLGCVAEEEVPIPQYRRDGRPNGSQSRGGLVARWELAPWHHAAAAQPSQTGAAQQRAVDEVERSSEEATGAAAQRPASTAPDIADPSAAVGPTEEAGPASPADEPTNTSE
jgi:hypothetical protein